MTPLDLDLVPEPPSSPAVMAARQRRALVVGLGGGRESDSPMAKSSFAERRLRASDTVSTRYVDPLPGVAVASLPPERRSGEGSADSGDSRRVDGVPSSLAARRSGEAPTDSSGPSTPPMVGGGVSSAAAASAASMSAALAAAAAPASMASSAWSVSPGSFVSQASSASRATPAATAHSPVPTTPGSARASASSVAAAPTAGAALRLDDALVVPAGALMRGYLRCHALLLVGDVVGNVHCTAGPVVIRSGASLKGRLVASGDVYVCGTVGDTGGGAVITTSGKLTLAPGARVDGDVRSGQLDVYDGAVLNGAAKRCED